MEAEFSTKAERLLTLEQAFLSAVESRVAELDHVIDPRTGQRTDDVQFEPFAFSSHCRTDSQLAHRLLLRQGFTAHEIERALQTMPVNRAVAWQVRRRDRKLLRDAEWIDAGLIIAAVCWSPLPALVEGKNSRLESLTIAEVGRIIDRKSFPADAAVWLAVGSTTGLQGPLPRIVSGHVYSAYFEPAPVAGWIASADNGAQGSNAGWFTRHLHPEDDRQLNARLARWFRTEGRRIALGPAGLTVGETVTNTGIPERLVDAFFKGMVAQESDRWLYEESKQRLIFLGP